MNQILLDHAEYIDSSINCLKNDVSKELTRLINNPTRDSVSRFLTKELLESSLCRLNANARYIKRCILLNHKLGDNRRIILSELVNGIIEAIQDDRSLLSGSTNRLLNSIRYLELDQLKYELMKLKSIVELMLDRISIQVQRLIKTIAEQ